MGRGAKGEERRAKGEERKRIVIIQALFRHPTSNFRLLALFQQIVNVLDIIEGIVDKKIKFGDGTHLVVNPVAKFKPDFFPVFFNMSQKLIFLGFTEEAEVNLCQEKIG